MSIFKRFVLVLTSMFVISASIVLLINKNIYFHIDTTKLYIYIFVSTLFIIHNTVMIMHDVSKKYLIVDNDELSEKINNRHKGSDEI